MEVERVLAAEEVLSRVWREQLVAERIRSVLEDVVLIRQAADSRRELGVIPCRQVVRGARGDGGHDSETVVSGAHRLHFDAVPTLLPGVVADDVGSVARKRRVGLDEQAIHTSHAKGEDAVRAFLLPYTTTKTMGDNKHRGHKCSSTLNEAVSCAAAKMKLRNVSVSHNHVIAAQYETLDYSAKSVALAKSRVSDLTKTNPKPYRYPDQTTAGQTHPFQQSDTAVEHTNCLYVSSDTKDHITPGRRKTSLLLLSGR